MFPLYMLSIYIPFIFLKAALNTRAMDVMSVHEKNNNDDVDELSEAHNSIRQLHFRCHLQNL